MNLFSGQQWRKRHREQTYGHGGGEKGEGEMYGESNIEIYNSVCKIDRQQELKQGLCDWVKGRLGRREVWEEGTWVYLWLILIDV